MKHLTLPCLASAIALAACTTQPAQPYEANGVPLRSYYHAPEQLADISGLYHMDNGENMRVYRAKRRFWIDMPSTGRVEVVPVDSYVFLARDGRVRARFEPLAFATNAVLTLDQPTQAKQIAGITIDRQGLSERY